MKTIENESSEENRVKFLQEAAIMGQFEHPNIVRILGVTVKDMDVCVCVCREESLEPFSIACKLLALIVLHSIVSVCSCMYV